MKLWKNSLLFYLGGCGYMALELLFRGRSHGSMFLAGGLCFLLVGRLEALSSRIPWLIRATVGSGIITAVELGAGLLWNQNYAVWDYRSQPGNLWGQICPVFSILWIPVSLLAMGLYHGTNRLLRQKTGEQL